MRCENRLYRRRDLGAGRLRIIGISASHRLIFADACACAKIAQPSSVGGGGLARSLAICLVRAWAISKAYSEAGRFSFTNCFVFAGCVDWQLPHRYGASNASRIGAKSTNRRLGTISPGHQRTCAGTGQHTACDCARATAARAGTAGVGSQRARERKRRAGDPIRHDSDKTIGSNSRAFRLAVSEQPPKANCRL